MKILSRYLTARDDGSKLQLQSKISPPFPDGAIRPSIVVDPQFRYQHIEGFGGAFTEAAAVTLKKMPADKQEEILRAYFDPVSGHGYSICRTHINSCDFSLGNYAYCEKAGDFELKTFSIERDRQALIPMIKRAREISQNGFKLFASPWSPPAWMKTTGRMNEGGKLKPECREAWARCYVRYIREYAREGIPIWGLTVQNEPEAIVRWDSCFYTGEEERDFVRDYLGPALEKEGLGNVKLMIWDHNRDQIYPRAKTVYDDPQAAKYVWGTAYHWYGTDTFENVQRVHEAWPDKHLLFTEGCQEWGPHDGEWPPAERYARSIIADLNRWSVGWVDWNMVLDETGGPNHVGNLCSAPIIADTRTGEIRYQPSYYYLGHFSRFIRPGARRIIAAATIDELETTACVNPDGVVVIVVLNRGEKPIRFDLKLDSDAVAIEAPARSIQTVLAKAE